MVSRETRVIVLSIVLLVPLALLVVSQLEQRWELPQWTGFAALLVAGVLLPQLFLWYTSRNGENTA